MSERVDEVIAKRAAPRSRVMRLRVTEDEHASYKAEAEKRGLALSDYFRLALGSDRLSGVSAPKKRAVRRAPAVRLLDTSLLTEIHAIGVNLNQIARVLNTANVSDGVVSTTDLLRELVKIEEQIGEILERHELAEKAIVERLAEQVRQLLPEDDPNDD